MPHKVLFADSSSGWGTLGSLDNPSSIEDPGERGRTASFAEVLRSTLMAEHVCVLAGLGASRYVKDATGKPLCPTMAELWQGAKEIAGTKFSALLKRINFDTAATGEDIEGLLSQCQVRQSYEPDDSVAEFIVKAEAMIVERCRFPVAAETVGVHEALLRKVARSSGRRSRVKVFTTNYDLCFERAASVARFVAVDGFSHTLPQEFDGAYFGLDLVRREGASEAPDYVPNVFHLYKLHGSVDWEAVRGDVVRREQPARPLIVYPRRSKFETSFEQPFLEMMARYQSALREPNASLLVVGCGLKDEHIVQPLLASIRANVGLRVLIVSPDLETADTPMHRELRKLIALGDRRLALLACSFEELVALLPDYFAPSEREIHEERLRRARS